VREAIARLGGLDVLINVAGLATPQSAGLPPDAEAVGGGHLASPGTDCRKLSRTDLRTAKSPLDTQESRLTPSLQTVSVLTRLARSRAR